MPLNPENDDYTSKNKKDKILNVALELFSKKGFDATSVDSIAKSAKVNKALIYYYFKSKNDIILSLFISILDELSLHLKDSESIEEDSDFPGKIKKEIEFFRGKKEIIKVLLMESLKDNKDYFLFECEEMITNNEMEKLGKNLKEISNDKRQKIRIFEFFTGIIPILSFIAYEDKWCEYFKCSHEEAVNHFLDSLNESHFGK